MRGETPEIGFTNHGGLKRQLKVADWVLLFSGIVIFTLGMLFLGPLKMTAAIAFLILVAIAFFSPKYGLYVLYGAEGIYILIFYVNLMALAPSQLGLDYTIGYVIEGSHLFIAPLVVLLAAYLMGFVARFWMSGKKFHPTSFESVLLAFLSFAIAWTSIGIANEHYPLTILTDLHVVMMLAFGIFVGYSFKTSKDLKVLFNFLIVISIAHWIFLNGYFIQQRLFTEFLFLIDLIRNIQGSSDIYSPFIPVMLALMVLNGNGEKSRMEKMYPLLVFLFSIRTVLSLSRGAILQVLIAVIVMYFLMPREYKQEYFKQIKRQIVYVAIFCLLLFIASPQLATIGFKMVAMRAAETGKGQSVSQGSLKYRALETQMVLESIADSPIIGYGPGKQTAKRMFTYVSASEEPYVHNGYLWYMLKFGAIGLAFLLYMLTRYFISVKNVFKDSSTELKALLLGSSCALIGILPIVLTNNVIGAVQGNIFVSLVFGILIFAERKKLSKRVEKIGDTNATS